jgi:hypothetical protein
MTTGGIGPASEAPGAISAPRPRRAIFGKLGLAAAFVPWAVMGAIVLIRPGWDSPIATLGMLLSYGATPLALILSVIGIFVDGRKAYAIIGTVIAALTAVFLFVVPLVMLLLDPPWISTRTPRESSSSFRS